MNLWMARLHEASSVKVEILKTDAKGGNEVVLGTQEQKMPVNYLHHDLPTFFIKVGPASFKDELLALRLTKVSGADVVIGFNANDYDSNLVILSKPPTPPAGGVMTFTFRNCTNVLTDDQISWTFDGKTYHSLAEGLVIPAGAGCRPHVYPPEIPQSRDGWGKRQPHGVLRFHRVQPQHQAGCWSTPRRSMRWLSR